MMDWCQQVSIALVRASEFADDKEISWFMRFPQHSYEELGNSSLGVDSSMAKRMQNADMGLAEMLVTTVPSDLLITIRDKENKMFWANGATLENPMPEMERRQLKGRQIARLIYEYHRGGDNNSRSYLESFHTMACLDKMAWKGDTLFTKQLGFHLGRLFKRKKPSSAIPCFSFVFPCLSCAFP